MDFSKIKDGKVRVVYQSVWGNREFPGIKEIEPTSKNVSSYKFKGSKDEACGVIKRIFDISNKNFEEKYKQAVSGGGNEGNRILTLHSSARLALQMFYNVEKKPLILNIEGKDVVFNCSTFEFPNQVVDGQGGKSYMDVVLVSEDRKTILFLESKFTEWYCDASKSSDGISTQYLENIYSKCLYCDDEWLNSVNLCKKLDDTKGDFVLKTTARSTNYLDGIKQIISHYAGIRRRISEIGGQSGSNKSKETEIIISVIEEPNSKVYLGEIIYDKLYLPEGIEEEDPQEVLVRYENLYKELATKMNKVISEDMETNSSLSRFKVLPTQLRYSEIVNYKNNKDCIDPKTLDFYGLN